MKKLSIILLVVMVSMTSCAINKEKEMVKESGTPSFQPKPLDDDWSKWLVGEWEASGGHTDFLGNESDETHKSNREETVRPWFKAELVLNGQFLIITSHGAIAMGELPDEQIQHLKKTTGASDEEIERFLSMPYKSMQIYTIDTKTGDIVEYVFDSLRCIAEGRGRVEGNKQTTKWQWSVTGQGTSSVSIREKVSDDKLIDTVKHTMPDGKIMEEKMVLTRKKETAEK